MFITAEDAAAARESRLRQTRANMFETRGIPFILLDVACLILGRCLLKYLCNCSALLVAAIIDIKLISALI